MGIGQRGCVEQPANPRPAQLIGRQRRDECCRQRLLPMHRYPQQPAAQRLEQRDQQDRQPDVDRRPPAHQPIATFRPERAIPDERSSPGAIGHHLTGMVPGNLRAQGTSTPRYCTQSRVSTTLQGVHAMKVAEVESLVVGGGQFVRITTDSGLVGLGQTACWGYPRAVHEIVQTFRQYLIGQDPLRIEHHWQYHYRMGPFRGSVLSGAVSAVDIALWDIKGQHFQAPIWELLGGRCRDKVRLHLLMGSGTPEQVHAKAKAAAEEGFTAIKWDPIPAGFQDMSLAALIGGTVDQVAAAREAVGRDIDIILELHRKLTPLQAIPLCHALAEFRPLMIEDPIQIDSIQSQGEIAKRIDGALANGERMHTIWE